MAKAKLHPLKVTADEKNHTAACNDEHGKRRDVFTWISHDGELVIAFDKGDGSPFLNGSTFKAHVHVPTLPAVVDDAAATQGYRYSIQVTPPNGDVCSSDPQVIIDDGGFDPVGDGSDLDLELVRGNIDDAKKEALTALENLLNTTLPSTVGIKRGPGLLFPDGIELISVDVEGSAPIFGSVAKISIEIAGKKS